MMTLRYWRWAAAALASFGLASASWNMDNSYDSKNVFAPSGRLLQSEYTARIVARGPLCVGGRCASGIVLAALREVPPRSLCSTAVVAFLCERD